MTFKVNRFIPIIPVLVQLVFLLNVAVLSDVTSAQASLEGSSCTVAGNAGPGTCQLRSKCPYYQRKIAGRPLAEICGFKSANLPLLCCPVNGAAEQSTPKQEDRIGLDTNDRISIRKCREYLPEQKYVGYNVGGVYHRELVATCTDKTVPLIVGGQDADAGEFPFMVALGWEESSGYEYYCGGTLISENFVLTAGHCTSRRGSAPAVVRLGDLNLKSSADDASAKTIRVKKIIVHPGYAYPVHDNDVALVELEQRIPSTSFGTFIRAGCLWTSPTVNSDRNQTIAIGWGEQQTAETRDKLQKVVLELYKSDTCKRIYRVNKKTLPNGFLGSMLCSGYLGGGKDSCQGDSGGPLISKKAVGNCDYYHIIGVTSFGRGCAEENIAGVYTRVSSFIDWIEENVWPQ